jgi:hypothetical protein
MFYLETWSALAKLYPVWTCCTVFLPGVDMFCCLCTRCGRVVLSFHSMDACCSYQSPDLDLILILEEKIRLFSSLLFCVNRTKMYCVSGFYFTFILSFSTKFWSFSLRHFIYRDCLHFYDSFPLTLLPYFIQSRSNS